MDRHDPPHDQTETELLHHAGTIKTLLAWHLLLVAGAVAYYARDLFLPVFLAFLLALTLRPVVRTAERRRVPPPATAALLAVSLALCGAMAAYFGAAPAQSALNELPDVMSQLRETISGAGGPMEQIKEVSEEVEEMTEGNEGRPSVVIDQPDFLRSAATGALSATATLIVSLVLATLLLGSGDLFHRKLVQSFPAFADKRRAFRAALEVERRISRYLLTITIINGGLGICVALSFWALGMPSAGLFGALAFVLNYLPYIGAIIGIAISAAFALLEFGTVQAALPIPLAYFALTSIEGQFVTPIFVGRQLRLNTVAVFVAVVAWAWMWGVTGALMAVPFLVLVKVIADAVPGLSVLANFLAAGDEEGMAHNRTQAIQEDAPPARPDMERARDGGP